MLIRELLPTVAYLSPSTSIFGDLLDPADSDQQSTLMNAYIALFNGKTSDDVESLVKLGVDLRRELIEAKATLPQYTSVIIDLLHVNLTGSVLDVLVHFGWLPAAVEWTRLPFVESSEIEIDVGEKEVELAPFLLLPRHPLTRRNASNAIATWAGSAYYVSWRMAAYVELMGVLFVVAMDEAIRELNETRRFEALQNLTMILQWGRTYNRPEVVSVIRQLETLVLSEKMPELSAPIISFLLQGKDDLTVSGRAFWTSRARDAQTWSRLNDGDRIGILSSVVSDGTAPQADETLLWSLISDYAQLGRNVAGSNRFEQLQQVDRSFSLIDAFALGLLKAGRVNDCVRLYCSWYGLTAQPATNIALIAPTASPPLAAVEQSVIVFEETESQRVLDALVSALRQSLSQPFNAGSESSLDEYVPERLGVVTSAFDKELKLSVAAALQLDDPRMKDLVYECEAQCVMFSLPLPVQACQIGAWEFSRPLSASLAKPLPPRRIGRVALYAGESFQTGLEIATLNSIFSKRGIEVELFSPTQPRSFESMYEDPRFDLVWFAGHGTGQVYSPERAAILLDGHVEISVRKLSELEIPGTGQRLFVMNACETGLSPLIGRLPISGVAALVSTPQQATISHRWVTLPLVARVFGALLAARLADDVECFASFCWALQTLQWAKENLVSKLRVIDESLAQSVLDQSIEMSALVNCGSPLFQY